ncbi:MAG TPA: oxygenase MpaB family protein [Candidatus Dormibacteraeota bacterium]|nr:oxygenase MpaB family protein [Candidatus Dormibacteraeota bacterium]
MNSRAGSQIGHMEPLAHAFERSVPMHPKDAGLFGPTSMVWRVHRDRSFPLAAIRSLMVQALHPLAMAGVAQHSNWQHDPFGRLAATAGYVLAVTYGDTATANAAAARVRAVHTHVRGTDSVTGLAYRAEDPALLLWVHAGMVDSIANIVLRYGRSLDAADADRYVAEMARFAEIIGVPAPMVPTSVLSLREYLESVDLRQVTPAAVEAIGIVLDPPGLDDDTRDLWHDLGQVAVGTLPAWARSMYGFDAPPQELMERESVRQLIGALDFAFETLPGVLEAREQIELRMRA